MFMLLCWLSTCTIFQKSFQYFPLQRILAILAIGWKDENIDWDRMNDANDECTYESYEYISMLACYVHLKPCQWLHNATLKVPPGRPDRPPSRRDKAWGNPSVQSWQVWPFETVWPTGFTCGACLPGRLSVLAFFTSFTSFCFQSFSRRFVPVDLFFGRQAKPAHKIMYNSSITDSDQ